MDNGKKKHGKKKQRKKWEGDQFDNPDLIKSRKRVILALEQGPEILTRLFLSKLKLMRECGEFPVAIVVSGGRVVRVLRNRCRCRGCAVCEVLGFGDVHKRLEWVAAERENAGAKFTLLTLTMPHGPRDLAQKSLSLLFAAMTHFQKSASFKKYVRGWARGVEIPWSEKGGYHVHAHYIVEALLWPMEDFKRQWTASMLAVGGPYVPPHGAHIKGIKDVRKGILEAVGYPFKVQDLSTMPLLELCHLLYATKSRHLTQICRKWTRRAAQLEAEKEAAKEGLEIADDSQSYSCNELRAQVREGDKAAFDLLLETAQFLQQHGVKSVAANLLGFLKVEAERHGWKPPCDRDDDADAVLV